ncbi:MAG: hypothetical protein Q8K58_04215 [Acidimicrobiales bacterium]|nr:hypothetical protein [Acidimicrobiales bacterium]
MNAGTKLGAYGLVLAAVLGGGAVVGAAAGPIDVGGDAPHDTHTEEEPTMPTTSTAELPAGGLLVSQDGYSFAPEDRTADPGAFAFTIIGPDGEPVQDYELLHDRELHLIVASRDLQGYAHLHPTRDADGRWTVDLPELPPGPYRAFADFQPAGAEQYTLGIDLTAPGAAVRSAPLAPSFVDDVDGLEVRLDPQTGEDGTELTVTVYRDGDVVVTEPYLAAAGHLVALRDGDLAYLHVHPLDDEPSGPVRFAVEVPSIGTYALFFDFQVDGVVRTARFVLEVDEQPGASHGAHEG